MNKHRILKSSFTLSLFLLLIIFVNLNTLTISAKGFEFNTTSQANSGSPPLVVEKELSKSLIRPNETVTVKITIRNLNSKPVFDVTLSETLFSFFAFDYKGLTSPTLTFNSIGGNQVREIYYLISPKIPLEGVFLLDPTVVTYYFEDNVGSRQVYKSYSQELDLKFTKDVIKEQVAISEFDYYFLSIILLLYSAIIISQTIFTRLIKRKQK